MALRVVFLDHCAALSGGEIALLRLLEPLQEVEPLVVLGEEGPLVGALTDRGIDVRVLPLSERTNRLSREGSRLTRLPWRSVVDVVRYVLALRSLIRRERPDVVHLNSLKSGLLGGTAARLAGVPVVWHVRDRIAEDYLPSGLVRLVRLALWLLPSAILVNSHATLATLGDRVVSRVPHRVLDDPYAPDRPASARTLPDRTPVVAIVGRLSPWKGQGVFLDAIEALAVRGIAIEARVYGSALFGEEEYAAAVEHRVTELVSRGVDVRLGSFTGSVSDALSEVDVVVNASTIPEPFGQVVVEAIANGVPAVVPDEGGPAEIVSDGVNGLTFAARNASSLAAAVERLVDDPALYARVSAAGLERAQDFDPGLVAEEFTEFVASIR